MSRIQYKNWKSEIAWLRSMANHCNELAGICRGNARTSFLAVSRLLSERADSLEKAKGTAQVS